MNPAMRTIAIFTLTALSFNQLAHAAHIPKPKQVQVQPATGSPQTGPVPAQIATAHTVYLDNQGADYHFPGTSEEAYSAIYNALQTWGHYQLVPSAAQADLIFQLHDVQPTFDPPSAGAVPLITSPAFQIAILDAHTNAPLWTVTSPVLLGSSAKQRDKWYAASVNNLIARLQVVAGQPLTQAQTKALTTAPKGNYLPLYLIGGLLAIGIGTGFLMKHEFDKSVDKQNAALCAQNSFFCNLPNP